MILQNWSKKLSNTGWKQIESDMGNCLKKDPPKSTDWWVISIPTKTTTVNGGCTAPIFKESHTLNHAPAAQPVCFFWGFSSFQLTCGWQSGLGHPSYDKTISRTKVRPVANHRCLLFGPHRWAWFIHTFVSVLHLVYFVYLISGATSCYVSEFMFTLLGLYSPIQGSKKNTNFAQQLS